MKLFKILLAGLSSSLNASVFLVFYFERCLWLLKEVGLPSLPVISYTSPPALELLVGLTTVNGDFCFSFFDVSDRGC